MPEPKSRRRPRSRGAGIRQPERTRQSILDAATVEFSTSGLGGARVNAIAKRAGTNKRMIYHYFGNKEAMFLAVLENAYEQIRSMESELHLEEMEPAAAMRKLVRFTFNYFVHNQHFVALLNSENLHRARHVKQSKRVQPINHPLIETLQHVVDRGHRDGIFRGGVDALQLYISIAGVCYFYFSNIHTLSTIFGRDLMALEALKTREAHVVQVIMGYLRA
ncbi:MAG: TetR/AcrR family transcriptional regulator [Reyranellaceae bacterium]